MNNKRIALAYCIDNIKIAEEIENRISASSPYHFDHIYCKKSTSEPSIAERLDDFSGPILLIISDNFLKSAQCMKGGLSFLQRKGNQLLPVVADGFTTDEESGKPKRIQTNFERVSDIIQYINFWQDQYLDLRRQKRQLEGLDEENFNAHLKVMREISSEAGEFLRLLRNTDYVTAEELMAEHFKRFFEFVDDKAAWEAFREADQALLVQRKEEGAAPSEERAHEAPEAAEEEAVAGNREESGGDAAEGTGEAPREETPPLVSEDDGEDEPEASDEPEEEAALDLPTLLRQAADLANAGEYDQSVAMLRETVAAHPRDAYLRHRYALTLAQRRENLEAARDELEVALELDPDNTEAVFLKGELAELAGDYQTARAQYETIAERRPDHPDIFYRLGIVLANHFPDTAERAADAFRQAFQHNPDNVDAYYQYAMLLNEVLDRSDEAAEYFQKVLKRQADHPFAHYDLALHYHRQGALEKAREHYLAAVRINSELQTEENDLAFGVGEEKAEPEVPEAATPMPETPETEASEVPEPEERQTPEEEENVMPEAEESLVSEKQAIQEETTTEKTTIEMEEQAPTLEWETPALSAQEEDSVPAAEPEEMDNPLAALKKNVERLEALLKDREKAARQPAPTREGEGKIAMITGATSGIGRATARIFAENGYRLILTGRRRERLERLQTVFKELFDTESKILVFDVRKVEEIEAVFAQHLNFEWRQIDVLINNAGKAKGLDPIFRGRLEHWEEMIDTNVKGLLYVTRAVTPYMIKRRTGHIINIGSTAGKEVYAEGNVYNATKFAVDAITKAMRLDLVDYNVRVSQISPGHVEHTEFAKVRFDGDEEKAKIYEDFIPLNAHDVAETIYFIASRPRHVTIQDIVLTGTQQAGASKIARSGRQALNAFIDRIKTAVQEE